MEIIALILILVIFYAVAEFFGRAKHIGKWWTFFLLFGGLIPGLIALLLSPSAKENPTKGMTVHVIAGWISLVLLGVIGAIPFFVNGNFGTLGISISFIILGIYLIQMGNNKIVNNEPKFYFDGMTTSVSQKFNEVKDEYTQTKNPTNQENTLYYIIENDEQSEPLSFYQLKDKKIKEETMVWRNGLKDWVQAKELKELAWIIQYSPPPIPTSIPKVKTEKNTHGKADETKPISEPKVEKPIYPDNVFFMNNKPYSIDDLKIELSNDKFNVFKDTLVQTVDGETISFRDFTFFDEVKEFYPPDFKN